MRKLVTGIAAVMLVAGLAACQNKSSETTAMSSETTEAAPVDTTAPAATDTTATTEATSTTDARQISDRRQYDQDVGLNIRGETVAAPGRAHG